jgi:hypothetical protein
MGRTVKNIELRTAEGKLILSLYCPASDGIGIFLRMS